MKAFVIESGELKLKDMEEPKAKPGEVVVSLKAAGVNRRDLGLIKRYGDNPSALIIGSDGAGVVESVGEDVIDFTAGDAVIINPALRWYTNSEAPPPEFDILGMPDHGTFAEKIAISAGQLEKKPRYLSWEEAGSLALPGVTGYRSLFTKGQLKKEDTLFIPGAGSGVATFLIQFAKSVGARVIVTSRSEEKRQQAEKIGADRAIPTDSDWVRELADEKIDLVIDSVGGATFNRSLEVLKKGGRIVIFGATTEDNVDFNLRQFFYGQYQLFGSTMGSREELRDMLKHMEATTMRPVIDKAFPMDQAQEAFDHLASGSQFGKVVLSISQ
ncbi:zinc-binding alcohol dehydrogenase/oxidoreductase [Planomicrobium stackebrandtii]|uniref:Zinc-binding alcohol dehydrogenase/oxidoreductase n=1 Tax=Planomicrobium stackebrandtii TaxID=253160 RepID=A0ABU0GWK9_9BACL|nr:zinc-binding dehydrogenase [Planomicrobium stackebrandtii]MDQ0429753.1 zinc-binding alcohol dehydrogenase/oxidoreductase [Planomicrobium stackebrandtii]